MHGMGWHAQYVVMAPVVAHGARRVMRNGWGDLDIAFSLILPSLLLRMIHNQIWISLSRYQTARSKHRIVDRGIEFDQVDRERGWSVTSTRTRTKTTTTTTTSSYHHCIYSC